MRRVSGIRSEEDGRKNKWVGGAEQE